MQHNKILIRQLGLQPYEPVSQAMHEFTDTRDNATLDEIWLVEHYPVFTQGQAGKAEHRRDPRYSERSRRTGHLSWSRTAGDVRSAEPETAQAGRT